MKNNRFQKGTAMLELILAMAITAAMLPGVTALIFHEWRGTSIAKNQVRTSHEISNAARWITQDGKMAETSDLIDGAPPAEQVTLSWTDRYAFVNIPHSSTYYLSGKDLLRTYDLKTTTVARDISQIGFSQTGNLVTITISCSPGYWVPYGEVTKTYIVYLRGAQ
ncbi:MAG: hypothetical protein Q8P44_04040 [Dehalococcoidia bacterium]|nr:hypothetical protein [Dehalococcoidia bacterium]